MTQISLRAYIREIDNLIERELLDEAIAHCRHILQTFPKHIETYRLLGKSYLEAKRYGDAADIFQRVLSAVPDDFVSHIGMAIVREDEGNLDSAIWHMERAFETNPANPAIQQELRRLIGRRDGFEPHKVRLTRGALARMYAQGELYPQAIAELQSALQEDLDRPDLQVLLAEMLWHTDQKMEAADVSRQILEKLPYCQKAGRIMAAVHQEQGKSEEGTAYHRRLAQLDPYAAYVEYPMIDTVKVEADTIRIERLDWRPGQPLPASESAQPDWASSLGVEIESDSDDVDAGGPLPSWLNDIEPASASLDIDDGEEEPASGMSPFEAPSLADDEPVPPEDLAEADIPDWMTEAGWEESSGEAVEAPVSFSESELSSLERGELPAAEDAAQGSDDADLGELAPAEIPSWLQQKAPEAAEAEPPADLPVEAAELEPPADLPVEAAEPPSDGVPDWIEDLAEPEPPAAESGTATEVSDLTPDWLGQMASESVDEGMDAELPSFDFTDEEPTADAADITSPGPEGGEVPAWLDDSEPGATSTILTWLGNREEGEPDQAAVTQGEGDGVPDWMQAAFEGEDDDLGSDISAEEAPAEAPPAWLSGLAQAAAESDEAELDELTKLRDRSAAAEDDLDTQEDDAQPGEIPSWLMAIRGDEAAEQELGEDEFEAELPLSFPWESEEKEAEGTPSGTEMGIEDGVAAEETMVAPAAEGRETSDEPPAEATDASSWLETLSQESQGTEQPWPSDAAETPDAGLDSATSWLENLGQADEEEPVDQMEPSIEEPEWMRGLEDEDTDDEAIGDLASTWLEGLADTLAETPAEPDQAESGAGADNEDVPNWLLDYETPEIDAELPPATEPEPEPTIPEEAAAAPPTPEDDTGRLKLLEELGLHESEASEEIFAPAPEAESEETHDDFAQLEGMDDDQIFDWLEGLAARGEDETMEEAPAVEAPTTTAEPPAEESEADLGWLEQLAEKRGITEEIQAAPAVPSHATHPSQEPEAEAPLEAPDELAPEVIPSEAAPAGPSQAAHPAQEPEPEAHPEAPDELAPEIIPSEAAPAWPSQAAHPAQEPEPEAHPEAPDELAPEITPSEAAPPETPSPQPASREQAPPAAPEPVAAQDEPEPEAAPGPEVPDWLIATQEQSAQAAQQPQAQPVVEEEPQPLAAAESPIADMAESVSAPPQEPEPPAAAEPGPEEAAASEQEHPPVTPPPAVPAPPTEQPRVVTDIGLERAREALQSGDLERAASEYAQLIKARSSLSDVVEDLEAALDRDPESSSLWQLLGDAYMKVDRTSDAVKAYNRGMKEAEVLNSARQALASGDAQRAAAQYGILIKTKKRLDDVIRDLEDAVAEGVDQPMIWQVLGDAYMKADRLDESIEAYRKGMSSV